MALETAIRVRLQAVAGVTNLISTRAYYFRLPQGAQLPAVTYRRVSRIGYPDYENVNSLAKVRLQVDCWGSGGEALSNLAEEVRVALNGFKGTVASTVIHRIFLLDESDEYEVETELYRRRQDYTVEFNEAIT